MGNSKEFNNKGALNWVSRTKRVVIII